MKTFSRTGLLAGLFVISASLTAWQLGTLPAKEEPLRDAPQDVVGTPIGEAAAAFAGAPQAGRYYCRAYDEDSSVYELRIALKGKTIALTLIGEHGEDANTASGALDPTYKPIKNKQYVRYTGFKGLDAEYTTSLLVHQKILTGQSKGTVKVLGTGETFESDSYGCKRL